MDACLAGLVIGDGALIDAKLGGQLRLRHPLTDLDLKNGMLLVRTGKGRKDRVVPIGAAAAVALDRYLTDTRPMLAKPDEPALFVTRTGRRLPAPGLRVRVHQAGHRIGVTGSCKAPVDDLDNACKTHDICYYECRQKYKCDQKARGECMTRCDRGLAADAAFAGYSTDQPRDVSTFSNRGA